MKYKTPTLRLYFELKSLNKRQLSTLVNRRLKNINYKHVNSIINIFFDTLNEEILENKKILIDNFIDINLHTMPEKRAMNYYTGEMGVSKPYNKIAISLNSKFLKLLMKHIDVNAYLGIDKSNGT